MSLKQRINFGWIPDLPDHRDKLLQLPTGQAPTLPDKVNLAKQHNFRVLDQSYLGSCVAHAISSAIEFAQATRPNDPNVPDFIENDRKFPISRLFLYYEARRAIGTLAEDSGCYIRDALRAAYNVGAPRETGWKYVEGRFTEQPPKHSYRSAPYHKITSYISVPVSVQGLKIALSSGKPVVFGISVFDSFMHDRRGNIPFPSMSDGYLGGHAMLCTGYDDATQRFNFLNSWGEGWGTKGYGTIPYNYLGNPRLGDDYWVVTDDQYKERM